MLTVCWSSDRRKVLECLSNTVLHFVHYWMQQGSKEDARSLVDWTSAECPRPSVETGYWKWLERHSWYAFENNHISTMQVTPQPAQVMGFWACMLSANTSENFGEDILPKFTFYFFLFYSTCVLPRWTFKYCESLGLNAPHLHITSGWLFFGRLCCLILH